MTAFLIKIFVKEHENVKDSNVREAYGVLASVVGIISNFILFLSKLIIGFLLNSVAVMADSINNFSDCGSSILTIIGFKASNKPPDEKHPFGHGRIEYFTALGVSVLIMLMGFEFLKTSVLKIITPEALAYNNASILVLVLTIFVKVWLSFFSINIGNRINSKALKAVSDDARNDVIITSITIISILVTKFTSIIIDGYAGVIVAVLLIKNGFDVAKDAFSPLIGESVSFEFAEKIKNYIEKYDGVIGTHDLIVHNYGPDRSMATIHVEVPLEQNIEVSHNIVDKIERDIKSDMGIFLLIHMDPVSVSDERLTFFIEMVTKTIREFDKLISAHDFRLVDGKEQINFIFDLVIPHSYEKDKTHLICNKIRKAALNINMRYNCIINVESDYICIK